MIHGLLTNQQYDLLAAYFILFNSR